MDGLEASVQALVREWEPVLSARGPTRSSAVEPRVAARQVDVARSLVGRECTARGDVEQVWAVASAAKCRR